MPVRATPSTATYTAVNTSTGVYVTGDAANHTLFVTTDGTRVSSGATPISLGNGQYSLLLSAAQMTGDLITIDGTSTTANVAIIQKDMATTGASSAGNGNVPINHNTGGANNLLMTLNSVATAGIQIEAYLTSVYASGNYGPPTSLGQATSIADGTWKAPIMIAAPASGTIGVTLVVSDAGKAPQATTTVTVSSAGTATTP